MLFTIILHHILCKLLHIGCPSAGQTGPSYHDIILKLATIKTIDPPLPPAMTLSLPSPFFPEVPPYLDRPEPAIEWLSIIYLFVAFLVGILSLSVFQLFGLLAELEERKFSLEGDLIVIRRKFEAEAFSHHSSVEKYKSTQAELKGKVSSLEEALSALQRRSEADAFLHRSVVEASDSLQAGLRQQISSLNGELLGLRRRPQVQEAGIQTEAIQKPDASTQTEVLGASIGALEREVSSLRGELNSLRASSEAAAAEYEEQLRQYESRAQAPSVDDVAEDEQASSIPEVAEEVASPQRSSKSTSTLTLSKVYRFV